MPFKDISVHIFPYCRTSQAEKSSRESKSLNFEKRNFHIIKRLQDHSPNKISKRRDHAPKFDHIQKEILDGVFDDDVVNFSPIFMLSKY